MKSKPTSMENVIAGVYPAGLHRERWLLAMLAAGLTAIAALVSFYVLPQDRELVVFGLYSIPSHMLISPFPHEPALLYVAKVYPAIFVATAGIIGCLLAGVFDYCILGWLFNHRLIRPKFENTRIYTATVAFFRKAPFWMLVVAALTPVPFYPIKFLSIASNYPLWKYQAALLVGRFPRFWLLAWLGYVFQVPNSILLALGLLIVALTAWTAVSVRWRNG